MSSNFVKTALPFFYILGVTCILLAILMNVLSLFNH